MIDLDTLIASTAPDVMPSPDVVVRHRAMLDLLTEHDQRSSGRRAVELDPSGWRARARLRPIVVAVAMLVALIGGLAMLSSREPTPNAPANSTPATASTTTSTIRPPGLVTWEPTRYPVLPSEAEFGRPSSGAVANSLEDGNQLMVIGRVAGDSLTDIALIAVTDGPQDDRGLPGYTPLEAVTIDGVEVERWEVSWTVSPVPLQTAQWRPDLSVSATDVAALLEEIGPASFQVLPDSSGYPVIDPLPEDFIVLTAPGERPEARAIARVEISSAGTGDAAPVELVVAVPAWSFGPSLLLHEATQVDINGTPGWLAQAGTSYSVWWTVDEQTWFSASSSASAQRALEIARSVELVDRAAWFERYPEASSTVIGS